MCEVGDGGGGLVDFRGGLGLGVAVEVCLGSREEVDVVRSVVGLVGD